MSKFIFKQGDLATDGQFVYEIQPVLYSCLVKKEYHVKLLTGMIKGTYTFLPFDKLEAFDYAKHYHLFTGAAAPIKPRTGWIFPASFGNKNPCAEIATADNDKDYNPALELEGPPVKKCECGKEKHKFAAHIYWCDLYDNS